MDVVDKIAFFRLENMYYSALLYFTAALAASIRKREFPIRAMIVIFLLRFQA